MEKNEQVVKSFTSAAKLYFGLKPDQSLREFMDEVKELSDADKLELSEGMGRHGIKIVA